MKIQVGANDGETITIDLKKIDSDTLNLAGFNVNGKGSVANTAATTDNLTLAGFTAGTKAADGTVTYSKMSSLPPRLQAMYWLLLKMATKLRSLVITAQV